jgi:hypothetical protein
MDSASVAIATHVSAVSEDAARPSSAACLPDIPSMSPRGREVLQILNDVFDSLTLQVSETTAEATFSPK